MKVIKNPSNLKRSEIDEVVVRAKAIIIDKNNRILMCRTNDGFSLIGGHINKSEKPVAGLVREIEEETGVKLKSNIPQEVFVREEYIRNRFNLGKNVLSRVHYFLINSSLDVDYSRIHLDEKEILNNFELVYVDLDKLKDTLKLDETYKNKKWLYDEILEVVEYVITKISGCPQKT